MLLLIGLAIGFGSRVAVLTLLLWLMIKLQKLNATFLPVLGAAALASGLDMIPVVGHYLAVAVLYLCIWKITQSSPVDAAFTVVIGYALMFAVEMLLITGLMPSPSLLRHSDGDEPDLPVAVIPAAVAEPTPPDDQPETNSAPAKSADVWLQGVTIKGTTENGTHSMVIIAVDKKTYTLVTDAPTPVHTTNGVCRMRLISVSEPWVIVEVNGDKGYLKLH